MNGSPDGGKWLACMLASICNRFMSLFLAQQYERYRLQDRLDHRKEEDFLYQGTFG